MSSGWLGERRLRFDGAHAPVSKSNVPPRVGRQTGLSLEPVPQRLRDAVERTRDYLAQQQQPEGYWVAELEGDTILESEYILLLTFLGQGQSPTAQRCAAYIRQQQLPTGGWAIYPGGPVEISASVKAYWALKIAGLDPACEEMRRACEAIRAAGGAEGVNSFTRYYMALLGVLSYRQCPAVPPELILLPSWCPFNVYEMSAWSRTILIPLSLLWAYRPQTTLPPENEIRELFLGRPEDVPVVMPSTQTLETLKKPTRINWRGVFQFVDRTIKWFEFWKLTPLRRVAINRCVKWIETRCEDSDGLGAIFPPIIWTVVALKCVGRPTESPEIQRALHELERLMIHDPESQTTRLQPCKSPVWDTAISLIALREAGLEADHPVIRNGVDWLLSKEIRTPGDWSVRRPDVEPSGWAFEFENRFYPDVDDTAMVLIALSRTLPLSSEQGFKAEFAFPVESGPRGVPGDVTAVLNWHDPMGDSTVSAAESLTKLDAVQPMLDAIRRGTRWVMEMQNLDGGWGAFDRDNTRALFTQVPFADHNAMIDPSSADLAGRMLEMFGGLGMSIDHPLARHALEYIWSEQEPDHAWFGRWGVNYIYGTWQVLVGLTAIGIPTSDSRIRRAVAWIKQHQQPNGGWGETPRSYDQPELRGQGNPTASQTAWALMGLIAGGDVDSPAVDAGVNFLLDTQRDDGTWSEPEYTGTGFPRVFYLRYHYYRLYFPLMALARVARLRYGEPISHTSRTNKPR